jgi:hypothetical protein
MPPQENVQQDATSRSGQLEHHDIGTSECKQGQKPLEFFQQMEHIEGTVSVVFVGLLNACARIVALEEGRCAHEQIIKSGWDSDVFVGNFLIDIYAKRRSIDLESVQQHAIM